LGGQSNKTSLMKKILSIFITVLTLSVFRYKTISKNYCLFFLIILFFTTPTNMIKINYISAVILSFIALLLIVRKNPFLLLPITSLLIDGRINEAEWENNLEIASDFIMFEPDNVEAISAEKNRC
jgi:hypothetical protein